MKSSVSVSASSTISASSPNVSIFAAKAGFVIPKNKLTGSLVPRYRGGGKNDAGISQEEESAKQAQRKTKWGPDLTVDPAVRKARALAYQEVMRGLTRNTLWSSSARISTCCLLGAASASIIESSSASAETAMSFMLHEPRSLIVADLDPSTVKFLIGITGPFLSGLGFLFILRIVMSWYPKLPVGKFPYVIAYAPTEPLLSVTRRVMPPVGGVDITPVVWFSLISFLNEILVGPQGLLVLLSQQV